VGWEKSMNLLEMTNAQIPSAPAVGTLDAAGAQFEIHAGLGWRDQFRLAIDDLREAAGMWRLAWTLSILDIKLRYRGSLLGPFWLTLSTAVMIGSIGFVYSYLFHTNMTTYLPFLTFSLIFWTFLSTMMTDGCNAFIQAESIIKGMKLPLSLYPARTVLRNLIILGHNIVVVIAVFMAFHVSINAWTVLAIPGFIVWLVDGFLMGLLFGVFCTRFRDVPQIISSILQILFFVTPIMWQPEQIKGRPLISLIVTLNPFEALMNIVRAPILGDNIGWLSWVDALLFSGVLGVGSLLLFARMRGRIAFWI
jgi:lipopolysaccharide transport system permease protein